MSSWRLPTRLEVGGKAYPIHSDYRDILDILHRLNDASEPEFIRWRVALALFYEGDLPRSDYPEAMQKLADFLNCGQTLPRSPAPPLLDWEQDAPLIAADINKAAGCEVRALPYLHWWTFMAWFNSIGDGQLATLLRVALRKESVDRNHAPVYEETPVTVSLSARRVWIEICTHQQSTPCALWSLSARRAWNVSLSDCSGWFCSCGYPL